MNRASVNGDVQMPLLSDMCMLIGDIIINEIMVYIHNGILFRKMKNVKFVRRWMGLEI